MSPPQTSEGRARFLLVAGGLLILAGLLANEVLLARAVAAEGAFRPGAVRTAIRVVQALLIGAGAAVILLRRREVATNLLLAVASTAVVGFLAGEVLLRAAIGLGVERVRDPRLYAGWCDHDDQWKLRYRWQEDTRKAIAAPGLAFDPRYGWVADEEPAAGESAVLLYGDSFAYGVEPTKKENRLAGQLERLLDRPVVSYAVPGYGLDQIYLRFKETHGAYPRPTIVFSLMTLNVDRTLLTVRDAPKPYFRLEGDRLELAGVPVPADQDAWHREHPPSIRSYLAAWVWRRLQLAMGPGPETEIPFRRREKQRLGRRILEAVAAEAEAHRLPLVAVVFYPLWELELEGWREAFLKRELERLGVATVDTKALLNAAAAEASVDPGHFYYPAPNNHPNEAAYRVVAEALAERLRSGAAASSAAAPSATASSATASSAGG